MNPHEIEKDKKIIGEGVRCGRGNVAFPEFLDLEVSEDGMRSDCLIYDDTPENRKHIVCYAKCNYNRLNTTTFSGKSWIHRYEIRHGKPVIVIQRIS